MRRNENSIFSDVAVIIEVVVNMRDNFAFKI